MVLAFSPELSHALYSLGGLVVGAVLAYLSVTRADARRNRVKMRGAARLLIRDVFNATLLIHAGLRAKQWPVDESQTLLTSTNRFNLANWDRLGATFTASMQNQDDWESVCLAFESMENENRLMNKGSAFDEDRLIRVRDRDFTEALGVLDRLQTPWTRRFRRFLRMRSPRGEFLIPRDRLTTRE